MTHRCRAVALGSIGLIVLASASTALAASSTSADVGSLATAESNVVALLHHYQPTAAWKAQFKAAEAVQNSDLAKVNADIGSPPAAPKGVLLSMSGSGTETTEPFTVPSSARGWHVDWSYNCANFGTAGNFDFDVYQGTQPDFNDNGPNQLGMKGEGVQHFYDTGTFHLETDSECDWTLLVGTGS